MKKNLKKLTLISFILAFPLLLIAKQKEIEIIGTVKNETINKTEILVFITEKKEKLQITGKLSSFIKSFYLNKKIKVLGILTSSTEDPSLNGKIEIKEIILNL